jgi:hypothetical protein
MRIMAQRDANPQRSNGGHRPHFDGRRGVPFVNLIGIAALAALALIGLLYGIAHT